MSGYTTIRGDVLDYDRRVENLSSDAYRLFMLTLYSPQRTILGVMRWVPGDAVPRARAWDEAQVLQALAELVDAGLVLYDPAARLLFNPMALEFSPIHNANQVKGAATALAGLPDSPVLLAPLAQVLEVAQGLDPKTARDLAEIVARLRVRRANLERLTTAPIPMASPIDTPVIPIDSPCQAPMDGLAMGMPGVSDGVGMGIQAEEGPPTTYCGGPEGGPQKDTHGIPMAMGSRVGACALPDPIPKPEEPPQTPPPETARATAGAAGSKGKGDAEGASRYEHLDPRNRGSGPDGATAGKAGTGNLPGLRPGG